MKYRKITSNFQVEQKKFHCRNNHYDRIKHQQLEWNLKKQIPGSVL